MMTLLSFSLAILFAIGNMSPPVPCSQTTSRQRTYIIEGVGIADVLIDKSTASDVVTLFGNRYTATTHNEYSNEMEYPELGLSFYYCLNDNQQRIFLIEVFQGTTSKGIVIGESNLKDVFDRYGKEDDNLDCSAGSCMYHRPGVTFYVKGPDELTDNENFDPVQLKVVEIDVVAPDKSSDFCDAFEEVSGP